MLVCCQNRRYGLSVAVFVSAGYKATVYNRTASKCDPLREKGAVVAATPQEVAEQSGASARFPAVTISVNFHLPAAQTLCSPSWATLLMFEVSSWARRAF